jgi:hypothetical protein
VKTTKHLRLLFTFIPLVFSGCQAASEGITTSDWKSDCVGSLNVSVPDEAEVGVTPSKTIDVLLRLKPERTSPRFEFQDGQKAGYTSILYPGSILVSETASPEALSTWMTAHNTTNLAAITKEYKGLPAPSGGTYNLSRIPSKERNVSAFVFYDQVYSLAVKLDDRIILTRIDASPSTANAVDFVSSYAKTIARRNIYERPQKEGACIPYAFITAPKGTPRSISTTYRLKSHPDITIWLEDSTGGHPPKEVNPNRVTAEYDNEFFWTQNYQDRKRTKFLDDGDIKLADIKGKFTMVELTRRDDTTDYGFFASARGDADKPDPTDIKMFVIRDAKNAMAKGITPMSKDEFIKLAHAIAASVSKRPTTPASRQ